MDNDLAATAAAVASETPLKKRRGAALDDSLTDATSSPSLAAIRISGRMTGRRSVPPLLPCVVAAVGDNPLLAALGCTPRSSTASVAHHEPEPLALDWSAPASSSRDVVGVKRKRSEDELVLECKRESESPSEPPLLPIKSELVPITSEFVPIKSEPLLIKSEPEPPVKREFTAKPEPELAVKREFPTVKPEFVAYAREHVHNQEPGDEGSGFSIDPSDRAVEYRANKLVRREILIASPAANDDDEWDGSSPDGLLLGSNRLDADDAAEDAKPAEHFDMQPVDMILHVFSFLVSSDDFHHMAQVSKRWRELTSRRSLCRALPSTLPDGSVNWLNFQNLGIKNKGTEGTCFKCHQRSTGKILAMKKARVFPKVRQGVEGYWW